MKKNYKNIPVYIGELPPPMGGVTIKNGLLLNLIFNEYNPIIINIYTYARALWKLPGLFIKLCKINRNRQLVYIGSGSYKRYEMLLWLINMIGGEEFLSRVNTFVMGGMFNEYLEEHKRCLNYVQKTGNVFYELHNMENQGRELGVKNSMYFPNCRDARYKKEPHSLNPEKAIRLIHFSTVSREKGVPEILKMAEILSREGTPFTLDIYGEIAEDYEEEFRSRVNALPNTYYCGVKRCGNKELYELLSGYDVFLLATNWQGEGCVGALVESKVAGIPAIVTDWRYNSEVVRDSEEGIVVSANSMEELSEKFANSVNRLYSDGRYYAVLSKGASKSVERYDFNIYLPQIRRIIDKQLG